MIENTLTTFSLHERCSERRTGGRSSRTHDAPGASSPLVAVVPESLAKLIADGGDPLGLRIPDWEQPLQAGVTRGRGATTLTMRAAGEPAPAMREALATARTLDSRVTLTNMMTLDEQIGQQMNPQRFGIYVLGALGGIALLLTVLGRYAMLGARLIRSLLYQIEPLVPLVLAATPAVIFGLALLVSLRPAPDAGRIDVTRSLRDE